MYMHVTSENINWRGRNGFTEASDLRLPVGTWPTLMDVKSHKTGDTRSFYLKDIHKDADHDVRWANYRTHGADQPITIRVFND